ncbi:hypothetical protein FXO38_36563 [Capsicum annuum]|nr:hypothetical protein FXO38_36563 [Capsicum annuum]KAF3617339.1 hypothetical protein FXO37_34682 [Capsicum annuum]
MKQISSNSTIDISWTWLKTDSCPSGTVPIKKITKDNLIRQRRMPPPEDGAIVKTPRNASNKFVGAEMIANLWNSSVEGTQTSACRLKIQKGQDSVQVGRRDAKGNWWLLVGERMEVGFWPRKIFTALAKDFSENIEWGGSVYSPSNILFPQMGSGFLPKIPDHKFDAYWRALTFSNDKGKKINAENTPILLDSPSLFYVIDKPDWGHQQYPLYMFYGGPNQDKLM